MTAGRKDGQESRSSSSFERRDEVGASVVVYGGGETGNDACCADFFLGKVQKRVKNRFLFGLNSRRGKK